MGNGITIHRGSGGGSGAPTDAQYVTLATNGTLSAERVLTAGHGIALTDAGAGSTVTAAIGTPDGCRVYNDAAITVSTATDTALTFNSERYDNGGLHSTSSNTSRITVGRAGKYLIIGNATYAANGTGVRYLSIRLNGATYIGEMAILPSASNSLTLIVTTIYHLAASDYVELLAYQNSGGNLNIAATGNTTPEFMVQFLGA